MSQKIAYLCAVGYYPGLIIMKKLDSFRTRYTVRNYSDRDIPREKIYEMLEAASHAPNTGNMQWYSVVVTRDKAIKEALAPAHFNQPSVTSAPVVLTFCIDLSRFEQWCRMRDARPGFGNFQSFIAAMIDTTIFAQQFCTIAELNGMGTCYLGTTTYNAPQIAEVLHLPERVVPVTTVTVGYEAQPGVPAWRLPAEMIIHEETFKPYTDNDIAEAYRSIEERPDSVRYISDNKKTSLAQVFTDVRYTQESSEYFSKVYADFIEKSGFNRP